MEFQVLGPDNVKQYIEYLKTAMTKEPEMMTTDIVDEEGYLANWRKTVRPKASISII